MKSKETKIWLMLLSIVVLGAVFRFYDLDNLPMEMFCDIPDGYRYVQRILQGERPLDFFISMGPLFFYLTAFFSLFFKLSFLTMKITSAMIGLAIIIGSYLLGKELFGFKVGLLTAFLIAVSKWSLAFGRIGNIYILVPCFVVFSSFIFLKIMKRPKNFRFWIILGILLGIGMYTYASYFVFPMAIYFLFLFKGPKFLFKNFDKVILMSVIFFLLSSYFLKMFFGNLSTYTDSRSYFGHKIFVAGGKLASDWPEKLSNNLIKTFLMFNWKGDPGFRVNPLQDPQLDPISGLFFLVGIGIILIRKQWKDRLNIMVLSLFLLIPEILVFNVPTSIPSSTMTIGVFPLAYLLTAVGINQIYGKTRPFLRRFSLPFLLIVLVAIGLINSKKYFIDYAYHLPNHNEGFPRLIAQEVDKLPEETNIYMYGGGWGEWSQPDWRAVYYEMRKSKQYIHIAKGKFSCFLFKDDNLPKYFILDPLSQDDLNQIKECFPEGKEKIHYSPKYHFPVYISYSPKE